MKQLGRIKKELNNKEELKRCAREFGIIGDLTRLKICYLLCRHKELTVSQISEIVGVSVSAVSHTLRRLEEANLVKKRRSFRNIYYQIRRSSIVDFVYEYISQRQNRSIR